MAEHSELVGELPMVEKLSTQERLKHARKRRQQQLKKFGQYEKQLDKENNKKKKGQGNQKKAKKKRQAQVHFLGNIMLLEAAARNDVEEVSKLLSQGVSPDVTNEDGLTALHQCCIDDSAEMMQLLCEYNANVNARDSELWSPLHAAATCGHVQLCKYLIDHGAELLAVNADGNMPYDICEDDVTLDFIESEMAKRGVTQELIDDTRLSSEKIMLNDIKSLQEKGGDLNFKDRVGATPLHIAAANGYVQVVEFLLEHNVTVNITDDDSWQPVHAAACWGHPMILETLVQYGADLEAKTKGGETPYDICEDPDLKDRILEMKSEIESHKAMTSTHVRERRSSQNPSRSSQISNSATSLYNSNTSLAEKNMISASIRRTSMREKSAMSRREAAHEARIRDSATSDDEDEWSRSIAQSTIPDEEVPISNIDDVTITVPEENGIKGHEELPAEEVFVQTPQTIIKEGGVPTVPIRRRPDEGDTVQQQPKEDPPNLAQDATPISVPGGDSSKRAPPSPPPQHVEKPPQAPKPADSTPSKKQDAKKDVKKDVKKDAKKDVKEQKLPDKNKNDIVQVATKKAKPEAPVIDKPHKAPEHTVSEEVSDHTPKSSQPARAAVSSPVVPDNASTGSTPSRKSDHPPPSHLSPPPSGTLADLKKQRQMQLQNSLRFRDTASLNNQIASYSKGGPGQEDSVHLGNNTRSPENKVPQANNERNGHSPGVAGKPTDYYDPPKHKFTATQPSEIIGDDGKTSCCVVQ